MVGQPNYDKIILEKPMQSIAKKLLKYYQHQVDYKEKVDKILDKMYMDMI